MAIIDIGTCSVCGNEKEYWYDAIKPQIFVCSSCQSKIENNKKQEHLKQQNEKSIKERLLIIEEWMYEHKNNHPVTYNIDD